jgi:hypothetical protein
VEAKNGEVVVLDGGYDNKDAIVGWHGMQIMGRPFLSIQHSFMNGPYYAKRLFKLCHMAGCHWLFKEHVPDPPDTMWHSLWLILLV